MSIKVMTMVFDRYPEGGNERLLALAMSDHARDDGTRIWPSVAELARKTMQSERTVQRQVAKMVARGWLQLVRAASGRPGDTNEYRINPAWIAGEVLPDTGDNLTPVSGGQTGDSLAPVDGVPSASQSVDKVVHTGDIDGETGVTADARGDTAMSPESSGTIRNHNPLTPVGTGAASKSESREPDSRPPKPPWRWRESFEGVCKRGEQLGHAYSTDALGSAWTSDQMHLHQQAYRKLVEVAHQQAGGAP